MDFLTILYSALGTIVTALLSWATARLIAWLNTKIKDKKVASWMSQITKIVMDAVQSVFQTFVEVLKENGKFDAKAQTQAKEKAMGIIFDQLTPELKEFISDNFGDIKNWLGEQIEAIIYQLKNK